MSAIIDWLKGKKTYLMAAGVAIYGFGIAVGWWQHNVAVDLILGGGTVAAARAALVNSQLTKP